VSRTWRRVVGVVGAGTCDAEIAELARDVGRRVAEAGAVLLCGGRGGVMEAASAGAHAAGGLVVGVLPGRDGRESPPNPHVDVALFTGLNDARNYVNVCSSDAVVAIAGSWGTLSEIALARKVGRPVVLLRSWDLASTGLPLASTPAEAVRLALEA